MSGAPAWHLRTTERVKLLAGAARIVSVSAKPQMKVPFLDLKAHHAPLLEKFNRAIREVIDGSAFAGGPFVEKFEKEFAAYCRSKYAIGVGNGTDALWLALLALGIGPGDEVIRFRTHSSPRLRPLPIAELGRCSWMWTKTRLRWIRPNWRRASRQEPRQSSQFTFSVNPRTWTRFCNSPARTASLSLKMPLKPTAPSTRVEKRGRWATRVASVFIPEKILALSARLARW